MRSWLAAADIVVAPLRTRELQNNCAAMAMRVRLASPAAFEGIEADGGRDLAVADGAAAMATAINRLLANPDEGAALGRRARLCVERSYSWEQRLAPLAEIVFPASEKAAA